MKLLIVTQKVNIHDPVLGFFHRWIEEFARTCERVTVICLEMGEHSLPPNVKVLSLGKERGNTKFDQAAWFFQHIWDERENYDRVLVHMNQEYVLLGAWLWRIMGKQVLMWRNHPQGSLLTRLAILLSHKVFTTTPYSYVAKHGRNIHYAPVGVDTRFFKGNSEITREKGSIVFLGRIAPIKRVEVFIDALKNLKEKKIKFSATIAGGALPSDSLYESGLKDRVRELGLSKDVRFSGWVDQEGARDLFQKHEIYVNLTPSGSLDKTIFEAMACKLVTVSENPYLSDVFPEWVAKNQEDLVSKLERALSLKPGERREIENKMSFYVEDNHSLEKTVESITK